MSEIFVRTARRSSLGQIRHVSPVPPAAAPDSVAQVYAQVELDFGMLAPPIALHAPAPGPLAASWLMLRETLLAAGHTDRAAKEAVGTAVSLGNTCPYCVAVHGATLGGLIRGGGWGGAGDAAALAAGRVAAVADPGLRRIADWAAASGRRDTAGRHPVPAGPVGQAGQAGQAAELIGVAVTFQYLNRMVNVFLPESPFPAGLPTVARGGLLRLLTRILRPVTWRARPPGGSLDLLPGAPLPRDLSWAAAAPGVAGAFARAAAAIGAAGERSASAAVRELVAAELAGWDGEPRGPGRGWAAAAAAGVPPGDRPAGRLALLTAFASYQVGESVIEEFRRERPGDGALIELTSWASLAAAREVGRWSAAGARPDRAAGRVEKTGR